MNISGKFGLCHVVVVELRFPMNLLNHSEYLFFTTLSMACSVGSFGFILIFSWLEICTEFCTYVTRYFCSRTYWWYLEKCFVHWQWLHVIYRLVQNHGKFNTKLLKLYFKNSMPRYVLSFLVPYYQKRI